MYLIANDRAMYVINKSGNTLWSLPNDDFSYYSLGISFSPDGNTLYIPGLTKSLYALDINTKNIKWGFGDNEQLSAPVISSDGTVFLLTKPAGNMSSLIALTSNGEKKWEFSFHNDVNFWGCVPAIDRYGNIYFAADTLFALDFKGILKWKKSLDKINDCPVVCDESGNIYLGLDRGGQSIEIKCFDKDGNIRWSTQQNQNQVGVSPAIGFGKLFFPTWASGKLFIIK